MTAQTPSEMISQMKLWYWQANVKFNIIRFLRNRELALLPPKSVSYVRPVRHFRAHNVQSLDFILGNVVKAYRLCKPYNLYASVAEYKNGLPLFTPDLSKRDTSEWRKNHWQEISGYDWLIDIDAGSHEEIELANETMLQITALFNKLRVPYECRFSGCGYHVIVPYIFFSGLGLHFNPLKDGSIYQFYVKLGRYLFDNVSELIDYNITDSRRIAKLPYSLAFYENDTYVCLPLKTRSEMTLWKSDDFLLQCWHDKPIKDRGTFMFNEDCSSPRWLLEWIGIQKEVKKCQKE